MENSPNSTRRNWAVLATGLILVGLSIAFVDRAAASWSHDTLHRPAFCVALTHIIDPLRPLAVLGLVLAGLAAALGGWRPGEAGLTLIACCLAIAVSFEVKEELKYLCGRTWPDTWVANNPSWIVNGAYGFHFLHGGEGWSSFPSGHMTQISALAGVLWQRVQILRWAWILLPLLVAIGLLGSDFHFVGDMVAGTFLGASCAAGVLALLRSTTSRSS